MKSNIVIQTIQSQMKHIMYQGRSQKFSRGGARAPESLKTQAKCTKNASKMKKIFQEGGARAPKSPPWICPCYVHK